MIFELIKAFIVGILVIAPAGPTGIISIKNNVTKRGLSGLITGFGGATADLVYSIIAIFSISRVSDFIIMNKSFFELIGGLTLLVIGFKEIFSDKPHKYNKIKVKNRPLNDYFTGFGVTIANPGTLLVFLSLYTITGIFKYATTPENSLSIIIMSLFGSIFGWGILNYGVSRLKKNKKISSKKRFILISKISGAVLIGFSFFLFLNATIR